MGLRHLAIANPHGGTQKYFEGDKCAN